MMVLPVTFTYLFAQFPAGLVIYFTWSNILGIIQQAIIMHSQGQKPKLYLRDPHKKARKAEKKLVQRQGRRKPPA
jgi:YidC/Oxa1 family membrane protein insertase